MQVAQRSIGDRTGNEFGIGHAASIPRSALPARLFCALPQRGESFTARANSNRLPNTVHKSVAIQPDFQQHRDNLLKKRLRDTDNGFTTKH